MDDLLRTLLLRDEGYRRSAYQDSLGFWTIGIGKLIDARKGGGITLSEAVFLLDNELVQKMRFLDAEIPWWRQLSPVRRAVLMSMAFQLGAAGLLSFRTTLRHVESGRFAEAAEAMLLSRWATQSSGLALRMSEAMRTDDESAFRLDEEPPSHSI
jgi:lysozyme